jgi:hypothetical protein
LDQSLTPKKKWLGALGFVLIAALAVLLHWPSLRSGLAADDYLQRAMLDHEYPVPRGAWDLYSFLRKPGELAILMDAGIAPWWSHPELRLSLLRPVSSLLLCIDHRWLGLNAFQQHVHSMAWLVAFVFAYQLFVRRFLSLGPALIATAVMAFDATAVAPVAWICNRTSLVSASFGLVAMWAYLRYREDGWKRGAFVAGGFFFLALAAGEYALCFVPFVLAFELLVPKDAWLVRLRSSLLVLVPAVVYLALHKLMNYGAAGSNAYVGPFDSPVEFTLGAIARVPALIASELLLLPAEAVYLSILVRSKELWTTVFLLGVIALLFLGTMRRAEPRLRRHLGMCALGMLLALVPLAGTVPSVRLLLVPSIGGSVLIAAMIWDTFSRLAESETRKRVRTWGRVLAALPLALQHMVFSPTYTYQSSKGWRDIVGGIRKKHIEAEIDDEQAKDQEFFLLNAAGDIATLIYPPWVRHHRGSPLPRRWFVLAIAIRPLKAVRVSDDTLELSVPGFSMFEDPTSQLFRSPTLPFHAGDTQKVPGLEIRVEEVSGWAPSRVRYRFDSSLDDPKRVFLILEAGRIRKVVMPPVGSEFVVPAFG